MKKTATQAFFPTLIYQATLQRSAAPAFNRLLLREIEQLCIDDVAGRRWSQKNYPAGYTSYASLSRLHQISPTFAALERKLNRHVMKFAAELAFDLEGRTLAMTDCWVNVMPKHAVHGSHLHPLSTISGTYYVQTPRGCTGLKFEDPRLDRYMAAPPRRRDAPTQRQPWVTMPAEAGKVTLFESWLRHDVPPNTQAAERVSISFNYNWF
jgi:uncharacterized protein (TIGR02466 family)